MSRPCDPAMLYDLAITLSGETSLAPLLDRFLERLLDHMSMPVGMILFNDNGGPSTRTADPVTARLVHMRGEGAPATPVNTLFEVPRALIEGDRAVLDDGALLQGLPCERYRQGKVLRLPIPGHGAIILPSYHDNGGDISTCDSLEPLLANLAKAIDSCRIQEAFSYNLLLERDRTQSELVRFRAALDASSDLLLLINPVTLQLVDCNRTACTSLMYEHGDLTTRRLDEILENMEGQTLSALFENLLSAEESMVETEARLVRRDGTAYPVDIHFSLLDHVPSELLIIADIRDISQHKKSEEAIFDQKERAEITLNSISDGVITTDPQGLIDYLNPTAERLTGWTKNQSVGNPLETVFRIIDEYTLQPVTHLVDKCLDVGKTCKLGGQHTLLNRTGMDHAVESSASPIRDRHGNTKGAVVVFRDVTRTLQLTRELSWQATHDALTGLVNRIEFERRLDALIRRVKIEKDTHALLYMDLDQFKIINDTCGHLVGDKLLIQLAELMKDHVRQADTLARLGGDEFGVLLETCPADQAHVIAEKLRNTIKEFRYQWDDKTFEIGVSIGMVILDEHSASTAEALSAADVACFSAKELGRDRICLYQPDDSLMAQRHSEMEWVAHIKKGLKEDRFALFCQAVIPIDESNIDDTHYEILVRMLDEDGYFVLPHKFIPAAERFGLMSDIDKWVIRNTFVYVANLEKDAATARTPRFAINLSGTSINNEMLQFIKEQFHQAGIRPELVGFEVTETAAIANLTQAHHFINELKLLGCTFALDDFGSGLSSFGYLKSLPVDYLKIDGAFVKGIVEDTVDRAMVDVINRIGHVIGIRTIAEFVENKHILSHLKAIGVDYAQGYGIDKPKPITEVFPNGMPSN